MPQGNVLSGWRATYPTDAKYQKPPLAGLVITLGANAVPNKHTYAAGTIQMVEAEATAEVEVEGTKVTAHAEASVAMEPADQ
jgi:hypothetical protein